MAVAEANQEKLKWGMPAPVLVAAVSSTVADTADAVVFAGGEKIGDGGR